MNALQISFFAIAVSYCLVCLIRIYQLKSGLSLKYLGAFLLIATLSYVAEWLMLHPDTPLKAVWLWLVMCGALWLLPFFWLSVTSLLGNPAVEPKMQLTYLWLFPVLGCLVILPLLFSAHWGADFYNPKNPATLDKSVVIHTGMFACAAIFACLTPCLLFRAKKLLDGTDSQHHHTVVKLLMLALGVKWLTCFLRVLHCGIMGANPGVELNVLMTLDIGVTLWALSEIFRQLNKGRETQSLGVSKQVEKYQSSGLNHAITQRILLKLERAVVNESIHRDSDLNLKHLSEQLNESAHHISQVLNQELGGNFYTWLNTQRVQDAQIMLQQEPQFRVLDIAELVGFKAKSTFNTAFRQQTGLTPSQYRDQFHKTLQTAFEPNGSGAC